MQIFVQGNGVHTLNISGETLVVDVKEALSSVEEVGVDDQILYYGGLPLDDDSLVCNAIPENGTLNLGVRILGGVLLLFSFFNDSN